MESEITLMGMPGELRLDAHGTWWHDGVEVTHSGIADYLSKHLIWSEAHQRYLVEVDGRAVNIAVDDTAYFVTALATDRTPWQITLNDGSTCEFVGPIEVRANGEFICPVKPARLPAKIGRSVHQQLQSYVVESEKPDRYCLRTSYSAIDLVCHPLSNPTTPRAD